MVDETDKALISLGVLVGAAIISAIIAKVVDICYDRASISDDASDISEHTRNLIRARLTVMKFRNKKQNVKPKTPLETETEKQQNAVKVFRIWSAKSKMRKKSDAESAIAGTKDTKLKLEDVGDDDAGVDKRSEKETKGANTKRDQDQKVEFIDETLPAAPVVVETDKNTIRPKSALKKTNFSGATTTNTAGATTVTGEDSARPKSGIKRVTIAEPESSKTTSADSRGDTTSIDSQGKQTINPINVSDKSVSSKSSDTARSSSSSNNNEQGPTERNNKPPEERPPGIQDTASKSTKETGEKEREKSPLPQAWNDASAEGSRSSRSSDTTATASNPKKTTKLVSGKQGWRETYVLYRGNSDDLLVPFDTKKKKSKSKRKGKKKK